MLVNLGSGSGWMSALMRDGGTEFVDVDIDAHALELSSASLGCVCADGTCLPFAAGSVDGIILTEVIEHVTRQHASAMLREAHRVLRFGGLLLGTTPVHGRIEGCASPTNPYHLYEFSAYELGLHLAEVFGDRRVLLPFDEGDRRHGAGTFFCSKGADRFPPVTEQIALWYTREMLRCRGSNEAAGVLALRAKLRVEGLSAWRDADTWRFLLRPSFAAWVLAWPYRRLRIVISPVLRRLRST